MSFSVVPLMDLWLPDGIKIPFGTDLSFEQIPQSLLDDPVIKDSSLPSIGMVSASASMRSSLTTAPNRGMRQTRIGKVRNSGAYTMRGWNRPYSQIWRSGHSTLASPISQVTFTHQQQV